MHILFSSTATVDRYGGKFYNNAIKAALPRYHYLGEQITCLAFEREVDRVKQELIEDPGVDFVFLKKVNTMRSLLVDRLENERIIEWEVLACDICVAHVPSFLGDTVARIAKKHGKPCLNVVVGCAWDAYWNYSWVGKLMAPFRYLSLRRVQADAAYSIYVTNDFLQCRYPTRGYSIGCSDVNITTGDETALQKRLEKIAVRRDILKLGTVAAVNVRYKGQEYAIKALRRLRDCGIDIEYHLVGGGDNTFLRSLADKYGVGDRTFFHGLIPHDQVIPFLDEMDLYIQPSKQEGLPRALIEAMSRGCLSLGSRTAGIPELLDKKYVFRRGNVSDIVRILSKVDKNTLKEQALRNFEVAKQYDRDLLNRRRCEFMDLFRKECGICE
ncbi:glycosyltransferase family 4 protein [Parabacteroides sp. ZJ-118]|uniref:glycosyltransferase family 4 protein n=1 Tax=Parabacteroides sp. ZJ-118 TaxID=2709398 RepID=UPI0013E9F71C|nr:glycosyltransferase [Parabacteroides sp. ZJ-118]